MGFDILSNIASEINLEEFSDDSHVTEVLLSTISSGMSSPDRFQVISSLDVMNKLCQVQSNERYIGNVLRSTEYSTLINYLSLHDIHLLIATLECLYSLSCLGESSCNSIVRTTGAIDSLVSLITVEAQSYGPKACILMRVVETVPGTNPNVTTAGVAQSAAPQPQIQQQQQSSTPAAQLQLSQLTPVRPQHQQPQQTAHQITIQQQPPQQQQQQQQQQHQQQQQVTQTIIRPVTTVRTIAPAGSPQVIAVSSTGGNVLKLPLHPVPLIRQVSPAVTLNQQPRAIAPAVSTTAAVIVNNSNQGPTIVRTVQQPQQTTIVRPQQSQPVVVNTNNAVSAVVAPAAANTSSTVVAQQQQPQQQQQQQQQQPRSQQVSLRISNDESNRQLCLSWLQATYESSTGSHIEQFVMYKQYLASMHKMGKEDVISDQHHAVCVR